MNKDGKFEKGKYVTIPETKNIKLPINKERVRLGIRVKNEKGIEYPVEVDYFVCPKEIKAVFGDEPTELTVFFPVSDREIVFPQCYEKYGSNEALQCQGDGEKSAQRLNLKDGSWRTVKCPCEHFNKKYDKETKIGGCVKAGYLKFMIPSVSIGTFYQCRIGGTVSIEECNSAFKLAEVTTGGCWAMIPFRMRRIAKKLKIPGTAKMKNHWVVTLEIAASTEEIRRVMSGEILYLGQQRGKRYELEATDPSKQEGRREIITQKDLEEEEKKEAEERGVSVEELRETKKIEEAATEETEREYSKKEYDKSKEAEAELEKERAEGKHKIKSYQESKTIYKKKQEEKSKLLSEEKDILELISARAKDAGIDSFKELMDFAVEKGIFQTPLAENLARKVLVSNKEVISRLFKAFKEMPEPEEKASEEKKGAEKLLADLFNKAKKAGKDSWKKIIYEGCQHRMPDGGYIFEVEVTEEEAKEILIKDPERYKKLEEALIAIAESGGEE